MRPGVRLALDWGTVRIGVAACDPAGTLAYPVGALAAGAGELDAVAALVAEYAPLEVVVGLPRTLSGAEGPAAVGARARAVALAARVAPVPVRLADERLTTVTAARQLRAAGKRARQQRGLIDATAAVAILEHALAYERARGAAAGELVSAPSAPRPGD